MEEVKATLRDAVAAQHVKHETRAARESPTRGARRGKNRSTVKKVSPPRPRALLRVGTPRPERRRRRRRGPAPAPRRPVDVCHGLRDPSRRAIADGDPLARAPRRARRRHRAQPPFASRPRLERPRAADAFRRDPAPGTERRGDRAARPRGGRRGGRRGRRRADVSRRYFDGGTFRRPAETTRAESARATTARGRSSGTARGGSGPCETKRCARHAVESFVRSFVIPQKSRDAFRSFVPAKCWRSAPPLPGPLAPLVPRVFFFFFSSHPPPRRTGALLSFPSFRIIPRAARVETPPSRPKSVRGRSKIVRGGRRSAVRLREG